MSPAYPFKLGMLSAMWCADYALGSAQVGVSQLDFHSSLITCKGGPPISVVCFDGEYLKPSGEMQPRATYFGLSMVGAIGGGELLKLQNDGGGLASSYALQQADGSTPVVLINQNNPETAAQTKVTLKLPNIPATATMTQMTGSSYSAQDGVAIDGAAGAPKADSERPRSHELQVGCAISDFLAHGRNSHHHELHVLKIAEPVEHGTQSCRVPQIEWGPACFEPDGV